MAARPPLTTAMPSTSKRNWHWVMMPSAPCKCALMRPATNTSVKPTRNWSSIIRAWGQTRDQISREEIRSPPPLRAEETGEAVETLTDILRTYQSDRVKAKESLRKQRTTADKRSPLFPLTVIQDILPEAPGKEQTTPARPGPRHIPPERVSLAFSCAGAQTPADGAPTARH